MQTRIARTLFAFALSATAVTSFAQQGLRDRDPNLTATRKITSELQNAAIHSGPFYVISRLQLSDIGYDQHFFLPSDSPSGIRWAISAPQRLYFVPTRKVVASIDVTPSFALVSGGRKKTQFGYSTRADLQFIFNHLWIDVTGSLLNDLLARTGEINRVLTAKERTFGVNGEFKYSSRTSATFSAGSKRTSYPTSRLQPEDLVDVVPLLDRTEHNYRLGVKHLTFPLTTLSLAGELSNYDFPNTPFRNSSRSYVGAGVSYEHGTKSGNLEIGPTQLNFADPAQRDYNALGGTLSYAQTLGTRATLNANVARDVDFSVFVNNNYYVADRLGATLNYNATRRLDLRLISQHGRDSYDVPVGGILRRDRFSFNGVGWNYQRRHIQGGFDVGYYDRSSNVGIDESHGIRVLLHLSLAL